MLPQIDFSTYPSQIFWALVSFGILYFMISKIIMPKFENIVSSREDNIKDNINSSDQLFEKITKLKQDYNTQLKSTYTEANRIRENKITQFNNLYTNNKSTFQQEINQLVTNNLSDIDKNLASFKKSQSDAVIDLAAFILEKMLATVPNKDILQKCYKKVV